VYSTTPLITALYIDASSFLSSINGQLYPIDYENECKLCENTNQLLLEYKDIFYDGKSPTPILKTNIMHRIDTDSKLPIRSKIIPLSKFFQDVIQETVDKWTNKGYIEKSQSEWASAVIVVSKKDGTWRTCGDYRKLNSITKRDAYPVPNLESQKQYFKGAKIFSQLDFTDAYL
ncbi:MAG: hypothetical protein ACXWFZ_08400, partial [Nitrososphaeraceae archaeon]